MTPDVGQLINGRYLLLRLIGDGGMGTVFEARHQLLGTSVALKFLHPHLARKPDVAERFLQEAQVTARILNPHVVRATDVDRTTDGTAFMVMEFVDGDTLLEEYERLRGQDSWLGRATAFDYILQIFEGVEAAHALGVVHRDLKPDNVMLEPSEDGPMILRILDFGIAKLKVGPDLGPSLTQPGMVMGTPEYMAPEQALTPSMVDTRADVFSLGVMLYEMLARDLPVSGTMVAIVDAFKNGRYRRLDDVADVPSDLADAVARAMASTIGDRFPTVAAFREAIAPHVSQRTISLVPPSVRLGAKPHRESSEHPPTTNVAAPPAGENDGSKLARVGGAPPTTVPDDAEPLVPRTTFDAPILAKHTAGAAPDDELPPPPRGSGPVAQPTLAGCRRSGGGSCVGRGRNSLLGTARPGVHRGRIERAN